MLDESDRSLTRYYPTPIPSSSMSRLLLTGISIFTLTAVNTGSPSILFTAPLLALLLQQVQRDLRNSQYFTPILPVAGIITSYCVQLPVGTTGISRADSLQLILPPAVLVAASMYATIWVSVRAWTPGLYACRGTIRMLLFPLLWATSWAALCRLHSLGRLLSWTPTDMLDGFSVIAPLFGLPGLDFMTACLAVIFHSLFLDSSVNEPNEVALVDLESEEEERPNESTHLLRASKRLSAYPFVPRSYRRQLKLLAASVLLVFAVSYASGAGEPSEQSLTDSVKIACILPPRERVDSDAMEAYFSEAAVVTGRGAKLVLWPEAAIALPQKGKSDFYSRLEDLASSRNAFVAPSYALADPHSGHGRRAIFSSLVGPGEVAYVYQKRALVPVAESYSYLAGDAPLPAKSVALPSSSRGPKGNKAGLNATISTAICHDTSFSHIMRQAASADLLLVPSSVFSERIAWERVNQLRVSARALNTNILVCDGATSGISAVVDRYGRLRYWQRGGSSFEVITELGDGRITPYGKYGEAGSLAILAGLFILVASIEAAVSAGTLQLKAIAREVKGSLQRRYHLLAARSSHAGGAQDERRINRASVAEDLMS